MFKNILKIDGMMCSMCEAHVNDVIRKIVPDAKKVSSSHSKGESTFVSENLPDEAALKSAIEETGYKMLEINSEEVENKGLLGRIFG